MCQTDKLQYPQMFEMLMDTNVFVADTGDNVDSIGNIQGLINNMKPGKEDSLTLPEGTKTATWIISYLRGTFCDNQEHRWTKVMLSMVSYSQNNKSNLFSVTELKINGWDIGGHGDAFCLRNNRQRIILISRLKPGKELFFYVF